MIKFILFLALIAFFGFLFLVVILGRVIRFFGGSTQKAKKKQYKSSSKAQNTSSNTTIKKFSKNEGEYVDYEEIKDE